ncbi:MAG: DivIVA domain-containing protein [candidate division Zixibacteria bacterium]|nr:DivIVA domain-containing protein [candidate division Zixibacteria bacterium]
MDLSPNDIRNYEFDTQMRGFDKEDVRSFLEDVATVLEGMKQQDLKLSMEIDSLKTQLSGLRQFEDTIKSAAIDARRNADLTVDNAKKEAELIVTRAKTEADEIIGSRASKVAHFEDQINQLQLTKKSYLAKLRNLIQSHLEMIEELSSDESEVSDPEDRVEVTESSDVTREKMEIISDEPPSPDPIRSEEANADDTIDPASSTTDEEEPEQAEDADKPVDPELAAALESYRTDQPRSSDDETQPPRSTEPAIPKVGELVETTALSTDIPEGFVVEGDDSSDKSSTDKVPTEEYGQSDSVEPNAVDIDRKPALSPDDLAGELDKVAAKFEEEMDKATQDS